MDWVGPQRLERAGHGAGPHLLLRRLDISRSPIPVKASCARSRFQPDENWVIRSQMTPETVVLWQLALLMAEGMFADALMSGCSNGDPGPTKGERHDGQGPTER